MATEAITIRLDPEDVKYVKHEAELAEMKFTPWLQALVKDAIEQNKKKDVEAFVQEMNRHRQEEHGILPDNHTENMPAKQHKWWQVWQRD